MSNFGVQFAIPPVEAVLRVLDKKVSDIYPHAMRWRLAECAVRHAEVETKTRHRLVKRAIRWLRDNGHL